MIKNKLALLGGPKVLKRKLNRFNHIGKEELNAAKKVIKTGILSDYIAASGPNFLGGKKVREFEKKCEEFFKVKYAISVNSWSSGLTAMVGAINIQPGDEIIVSPWTMCASASAILHWNAIPVFADISLDDYNLDPKSIEANISPYTKAIMVVDIFGQSAKMNEINKIAKKYKLKVISDTAQAIGAKYFKKHAGTIGDVGGYSLNYHKHIHTGEGGIVVTNSATIAKKVRLIRNHAEAVIKSNNKNVLSNMIGYNFRLGEIESAIGIEQLKKLPKILKERKKLCKKLISGLANIKGLNLANYSDKIDHVFYSFPIQIDEKIIKVKRYKIAKALRAEGVLINKGYTNLHLLPMYQNKIAYGSQGFPWSSDICRREISYKKGICPNAELLNDKTFMSIGISEHDYNIKDIDNIIEAFNKVWLSLDQL